MRRACLTPQEIPFVPQERWTGGDYPLRSNGEIVAITACSTGNPHCSVFVMTE